MAVLLWLSVVLGTLLVYWYIRGQIKRKNCFPGPPRLPIIGSVVNFATKGASSGVLFQKLSKTYGDIFSVKLGVVEAVVFNSYDSVIEILNHECGNTKSISLHPLVFIRVGGKEQGIGFSNGTTSKNLRPFSARTLKDFGFGKAASMDTVVGEEFEKWLGYFKDLGSKRADGAVEISTLFNLSLFNVLWRYVTGIGFPMDNPKINHLLDISIEWTKLCTLSLNASAAFPFLWHMFPNWFGKNRQVKHINEIIQFFKDTVEEHRKSGNYINNPDCFVDVFLQKIEECSHDPNTDFTYDQLVFSMMDLFQAGSDTSAHTMSFALLYMVLNQDVQEKVQKELDQIASIDDIITIDKSPLVPYTYATVLEVLRFATVGPFAMPREAPEDFTFRNLLIRKGTLLLVNLESANKSEKVWGDPECFRPERFLTKGTPRVVDKQIAGKIMNFGTGKRKCLGETLSYIETFMYFATILRRYKISKLPGDPDPSIVPVGGLIYSPQECYARFEPRN